VPHSSGKSVGIHQKAITAAVISQPRRRMIHHGVFESTKRDSHLTRTRKLVSVEYWLQDNLGNRLTSREYFLEDTLRPVSKNPAVVAESDAFAHNRDGSRSDYFQNTSLSSKWQGFAGRRLTLGRTIFAPGKIAVDHNSSVEIRTDDFCSRDANCRTQTALPILSSLPQERGASPFSW